MNPNSTKYGKKDNWNTNVIPNELTPRRLLPPLLYNIQCSF